MKLAIFSISLTIVLKKFTKSEAKKFVKFSRADSSSEKNVPKSPKSNMKLILL
jgi:hypothetical protein